MTAAAFVALAERKAAEAKLEVLFESLVLEAELALLFDQLVKRGWNRERADRVLAKVGWRL